MAVQTPVSNSLYDIVVGSLRMEIAKFASIANNDTYVSGLTSIVGWSIDGGTSAPTCGISTSGATVTFLVSSGPAINASLILFGY
jgi:hypothetical protein